MADHAESVRDRLVAHTGTNNLISGRAYHSALPQNPTLPACVVMQISAVPEPVMGDDAGIVFLRVQVDSWDNGRTDVVTLGEQVRDALQRFVGTVSSVVLTFIGMNTEGARWDPQAKAWRYRADFELWGTE